MRRVRLEDLRVFTRLGVEFAKAQGRAAVVLGDTMLASLVSTGGRLEMRVGIGRELVEGTNCKQLSSLRCGVVVVELCGRVQRRVQERSKGVESSRRE